MEGLRLGAPNPIAQHMITSRSWQSRQNVSVLWRNGGPVVRAVDVDGTPNPFEGFPDRRQVHGLGKCEAALLDGLHVNLFAPQNRFRRVRVRLPLAVRAVRVKIV